MSCPTDDAVTLRSVKRLTLKKKNVASQDFHRFDNTDPNALVDEGYLKKSH